MSSKQKIKFLSIIIAILFLFYFIGTFLIIPDIKKNTQNQENIENLKQEIKNLQNIKENLDDIYASMRGYNKYLRYMHENLDKIDLENLFSLYAKSVVIEKLYTKSKEDLIEKSYIVDMKIDTPKKLYDLIKYINENSMPIKFEYPIIFEKNDHLIDLKFTAVVYFLE
ncbi:hypothetical protein [Nitrosophilus kaiyonis]|uniref:hypothetical protein n=1 Tax=Nitrosophilus kaiyonis TaxID=2930200 RepID=UPI00248FA3F1|nr:hypothetical protein [Nitrosophilus kaiyonis]